MMKRLLLAVLIGMILLGVSATPAEGVLRQILVAA